MPRRALLLLFALCALLCFPGLPGQAFATEGWHTYYIDVDVANQIVTVRRSWDDVIVRQMLCSSGTGDRTPKGRFNLEASRPDTDRKPWYYISNYHCFVKYPTRIKGSILFHSIPYGAKEMDSIDAEALDALGAKASHGCIRLRWRDARWIALNCEDGTSVHIHTGAILQPGLRGLLLAESYARESGVTYEQFTAPLREERAGALGLGASNDEVLALQQRLESLGFLRGDLSGVYDSATVMAVTRYQAAVGLPVTGVAGKTLIDIIDPETGILIESREPAP